jgi:hypothetical protein
MFNEKNVRASRLEDIFPKDAIVKLNPILLTPKDATETMVEFDGQTVKAVWDTQDVGSYFILIEGENVVAIRIRGDK